MTDLPHNATHPKIRDMSQTPSFSRDDPVSLAMWLIYEYDKGLDLVWPSTSLYAERLVEGLTAIYRHYPDKIMAIAEKAPKHVALDWNSLLSCFPRR